MIFQRREMQHCGSTLRLQGRGGGAPPRACSRALLDRLALDANLGDRALEHAHARVLGDLDFDLAVVAHLGDLADDAAAR